MPFAITERFAVGGFLSSAILFAGAPVTGAQEVTRLPFRGVFAQISGQSDLDGQAPVGYYLKLKGAGVDCMVFDPDLVSEARQQPPKGLNLGVRFPTAANRPRVRIRTWIEPDWSSSEACHPSVRMGDLLPSDRLDIDAVAQSGTLHAAADGDSTKARYRAGSPIELTMVRPHEISGVVVDAEGKVVPGAMVQALDVGAHEWTMSDAAGRFVVSSVGPTSAVRAVLSSGRAAVAEIDVTNPSIVVSGTLERRVRVTAGRRPVSNALVILRRADLLEARYTNLDGRAVVPDLVGANTILVSAKGYREEVRPLDPTRRDAALEVRLEPMGITTIEAVDSLDRPVDARFIVFAETALRSEKPVLDRRNSGGTLRLRGTRGEGFRVVLRSAGYREKVVTVQVGLQPKLRVPLTPGLEFSGTVTDINGRPLAATVVLRRFQQSLGATGSTRITSFEDEADSRTSKTDPKGVFRAVGLEAGLHRMIVRAPGMVTFCKEVTLSAASNDETEAIVLGPGASISGRLLGKAGKRTLSARAVVPGPCAGWIQAIEVRPGSEFTLSGLVEGASYDLVLYDPDAPESAARKSTTALRDVVAPMAGVELSLDPQGFVRGRISVSDGALPSTFDAMVCPAGARGLRGRGFCTHGQFGGSEAFQLEAPGPGAWDLLVQAEGYVPKTIRLTLPVDAVVEIPLTAGIPMKGRVIDTSSEPVPGAVVVVNQHGPLSPMLANLGAGVRSVSDELGEFAVPATLGVRYALTVIHQDYVTETTSFLAKENDRAMVVLHKGGTLDGVLLDQGRPVSSGSVVIEEQGPEDLVAFFGARETAVDENGRFQSRRLAPGRYRLRAVVEFPRNRLSDSVEAQVLEGQTTAVTLSLKTGNTLRCAVQGLRPGEIARVTMRGKSTSRQITVGPQTECVFHGVDDGAWLVSADASGPAGKRFATSEVVVDSNSSPAHVDLKLLDASRLHGVVKRDGVGIPGATVVLARRDTGGIAGTPVTDATGEFLVENLAPTVYLVAAGLPEGMRKRIEVDLSKADGEIAINLGGSVLRGTVLDMDGSVVPGAKITLRDTQQRLWFANTQSDDAGAFQIRDLENGTYRLRIQTEDHLAQDVPLSIAGDLVLPSIRLRPKP